MYLNMGNFEFGNVRASVNVCVWQNGALTCAGVYVTKSRDHCSLLLQLVTCDATMCSVYCTLNVHIVVATCNVISYHVSITRVGE